MVQEYFSGTSRGRYNMLLFGRLLLTSLIELCRTLRHSLSTGIMLRVSFLYARPPWGIVSCSHPRFHPCHRLTSPEPLTVSPVCHRLETGETVNWPSRCGSEST